MLKSRNKLILIGILSVVAIALLATMAIPAMADSFRGKNSAMPAISPLANSAMINGTLSVGANSIITITPTTAPVITLTTNGPSQNVTVVYISNNGTIRGLILLNPGQKFPTPRNPPGNQFSSVNATMTVTNNITTITPNTSPSPALVAAPNGMAREVYNKTTGVIQGLMINGMPQPHPGDIKPPLANLGQLTGNLTISGNILTVTSKTPPLVGLSISVNQTLNIVYNPANGEVRNFRLLKAGQSNNGPSNKITSINATLTQSANVITINPQNLPAGITLKAPANAKVRVAYNKTSGIIQVIVAGRYEFVPGLGGRAPWPRLAPGHGRMPGFGMGPFSKPNG